MRRRQHRSTPTDNSSNNWPYRIQIKNVFIVSKFVSIITRTTFIALFFIYTLLPFYLIFVRGIQYNHRTHFFTANIPLFHMRLPVSRPCTSFISKFTARKNSQIFYFTVTFAYLSNKYVYVIY